MGNNDRRKNPGFTLVEMIVVLVVLAVVAAITVPSMLGFIDKNKEKQCIIYQKSLVSYLDNTRVTKRSATMEQVMGEHTDLRCPAGGVYTAKDKDTVECSLHGSTSTMSRFGADSALKDGSLEGDGSGRPDQTEDTGSTGDTGGVTPPTEPGTSSTEKESETQVQSSEPPEPETSTEPPKGDRIYVVEDGIISINDKEYTVKSWAALRDEYLAKGNSWTGVSLGDLTDGKVFTDNGKIYVVNKYHYFTKAQLSAGMTMEEYLDRYPGVFAEINMNQVENGELMPRKDNCGYLSIVAHENQYYVGWNSGVSYTDGVNPSDTSKWNKIGTVAGETKTLEEVSSAPLEIGQRQYTAVTVEDLQKMGSDQRVSVAFGNILENEDSFYVCTRTLNLYNFTKSSDLEDYTDCFVKFDKNQAKSYSSIPNKNASAPIGEIVEWNGNYYIAAGISGGKPGGMAPTYAQITYGDGNQSWAPWIKLK